MYPNYRTVAWLQFLRKTLDNLQLSVNGRGLNAAVLNKPRGGEGVVASSLTDVGEDLSTSLPVMYGSVTTPGHYVLLDIDILSLYNDL